MGKWSKTRLLTNIVVVLAVLLVGAGVVMAARGGDNGPFSSSVGSANSGSAHSAEATEQGDQNDQNDQNDFQAQGTIQTITFDQGTTSSGNLEFLPDGQQATIIVDFTAKTQVEVKGGLQTNVAVRVEGTKQSDGSVLAKEIQDKDAQDNQGNGPEDRNIPGIIQSVDAAAQTFVFLPDGKTTTMTIAYDSNTQFKHENGAAALAAGQHVEVEVVTRADGSFYAKEIKNGQDQGQDGSGDGDQNGSGNGSGNGGSGNGSGNGNGGSDGSGH
jgi:hypothetical protein